MACATSARWTCGSRTTTTLEKLADGEVISPKPDLPNISSGETAGLVRRIARNLVQNTPNVDVISKFDDDSAKGIFARHILTSKIIGSDEYCNDMQQNLFASVKTSLTLGFACVIPVLLQDAAGGWYMKYDTIHYRDVFPEPGAKDIGTPPPCSSGATSPRARLVAADPGRGARAGTSTR